MTIEFVLDGQKFIALNGGPVFTFNPAISMVVHCADQGEVDMLWDKLSDGGEKVQCGWLTDRFGLSWQIVPNVLDKYVTDEDPLKVDRVMKAMLKMKKLDIDGLKRAYEM
ncbi:3-demethylubiquinone-9 3-methyltransferase [compost metagenome]